MPWVRLDEEFPDHPKVAEAGPLAAWLHVCGLAYCNRYLTDGFVPRSRIGLLADFSFVGEADGSQIDDYRMSCMTVDNDELAARLVKHGMWEEVQGGYRIHDYLDYQPSKAQVLAEREAKKAAGRAGGKASAAARAQAAASASAQAEWQAEGKQNPSPSPSPSGSNEPLPPQPPQGRDSEIERKLNAELRAKLDSGERISNVEGWKNWRRPQLEAERAESRKRALNGAKSYGESLVELEPSEARDLISSRFVDEDFRRSAFTAFNSSRESLMAKTRMP